MASHLLLFQQDIPSEQSPTHDVPILQVRERSAYIIVESQDLFHFAAPCQKVNHQLGACLALDHKVIQLQFSLYHIRDKTQFNLSLPPLYF
ncbi:hypothetical protein D3C76_1310520 [compost metagenome]